MPDCILGAHDVENYENITQVSAKEYEVKMNKTRWTMHTLISCFLSDDGLARLFRRI